jgi:hypothetical protein
MGGQALLSRISIALNHLTCVRRRARPGDPER